VSNSEENYNFRKRWFVFGKDQGFIFALKYKLGIAKEGKDFY
jgi:hypothetical protein